VRIEDVKVITVIGAGNMGHQIGTLCALHGFETYITDTNSAQLKKAQDFVASYLPGRVEKGRISQETADITSSLIHFEPNIELASQNADVIIEAETGSSQTINFGLIARARAIPIRCLLPPSSSCG
jgi:3-hydroxybutyryl-CoA dehydrogenase